MAKNIKKQGYKSYDQSEKRFVPNKSITDNKRNFKNSKILIDDFKI